MFSKNPIRNTKNTTAVAKGDLLTKLNSQADCLGHTANHGGASVAVSLEPEAERQGLLFLYPCENIGGVWSADEGAALGGAVMENGELIMEKSKIHASN